MNEAPSDVKVFKTLKLEGNLSWDVIVRAYLSDETDVVYSTVDETEFVSKENMLYAYIRRNEDETKVDSKATYGVGTVTAVNGNFITVSTANSMITIGDDILKDDLTKVGTIVGIVDGIIEVDSILQAVNGLFIIGAKDFRIEAGEMRGYVMKIEMTKTTNDKLELFAVNSEVFKSFS